MFPQFSEITQIKICSSLINHVEGKVVLLYIIIAEDCAHVLPSLKLPEIYQICSEMILQI